MDDAPAVFGTAVSVFPNPSTGVFILSSTNISDFKYADVRITDVLGQNVKFNYSGTDTLEINLQDSTRGVYFLEIKNNDSIQILKLILEP